MEPNERVEVELKLKAKSPRVVRVLSSVDAVVAVLAKMLQHLPMKGALLKQEGASTNQFVVVSNFGCGQGLDCGPKAKESSLQGENLFDKIDKQATRARREVSQWRKSKTLDTSILTRWPSKQESEVHNISFFRS